MIWSSKRPTLEFKRCQLKQKELKTYGSE